MNAGLDNSLSASPMNKANAATEILEIIEESKMSVEVNDAYEWLKRQVERDNVGLQGVQMDDTILRSMAWLGIAVMQIAERSHATEQIVWRRLLTTQYKTNYPGLAANRRARIQRDWDARQLQRGTLTIERHGSAKRL